MLVEQFIRYKGRCYNVGTKLKFRAKKCGCWLGIKEGVVEKFVNHWVIIKGDDGCKYEFSTNCNNDFDDIIIDIIKPIYHIPTESTQKNNKNYPASWDVEIGWIWYIIIMIIGTLFNARWLIYIVATAIFFLWKNGKLGGKK